MHFVFLVFFKPLNKSARSTRIFSAKNSVIGNTFNVSWVSMLCPPCLGLDSGSGTKTRPGCWVLFYFGLTSHKRPRAAHPANLSVCTHLSFQVAQAWPSGNLFPRISPCFPKPVFVTHLLDEDVRPISANCPVSKICPNIFCSPLFSLLCTSPSHSQTYFLLLRVLLLVGKPNETRPSLMALLVSNVCPREVSGIRLSDQSSNTRGRKYTIFKMENVRIVLSNRSQGLPWICIVSLFVVNILFVDHVSIHLALRQGKYPYHKCFSTRNALAYGWNVYQ